MLLLDVVGRGGGDEEDEKKRREKEKKGERKSYARGTNLIRGIGEGSEKDLPAERSFCSVDPPAQQPQRKEIKRDDRMSCLKI